MASPLEADDWLAERCEPSTRTPTAASAATASATATIARFVPRERAMLASIFHERSRNLLRGPDPTPSTIAHPRERPPGVQWRCGGPRRGLRQCSCLLYTSDAADEEDSVDLGGR